GEERRRLRMFGKERGEGGVEPEHGQDRRVDEGEPGDGEGALAGGAPPVFGEPGKRGESGGAGAGCGRGEEQTSELKARRERGCRRRREKKKEKGKDEERNMNDGRQEKKRTTKVGKTIRILRQQQHEQNET
ncbi:hypothetical protein, partial [Dietzia maris]